MIVTKYYTRNVAFYKVSVQTFMINFEQPCEYRDKKLIAQVQVMAGRVTTLKFIKGGIEH